ncbi:hypothetical protein [Parafilimonas sp.]|uniref:hypothetical protein n=1 Tax=Parafilimonas sp. TaxID=1969739 RepID=UPI0039E51541
MATIQTMTPEEKRQHLHKIIMESKKYKEEAQAEFEKRCDAEEYKKIFEQLREDNAKKGIILPGKA